MEKGQSLPFQVAIRRTPPVSTMNPRHTYRLLGLLSLLCTALFAELPRGWNEVLSCRKPEGNLSFAVDWTDAHREVIFLLSPKNQTRFIEVALGARSWQVRELLPNGQRRPLPHLREWEPPSFTPGRQEMLFKIRENEWYCYVNGQLRGSLAAPFAFPGTVCWPARPGVKLAGRMRFLPTPRPSFQTDFMIEPGAPNELYPWTIQTGAWSLHTALQQAVIRPETDQKRTKEAPLTADKSPNFYSLTGSGKEADSVITTGYDFYDGYSLTASLQLNQGEAGLVFLHREAPVPPAPTEGEPAVPDPNQASFWALTIVMTPDPDARHIRLWKQENGTRTEMARATTPLHLDQWYLPGIRLEGAELVCLLDNHELFRVKGSLPAGGKAGLYAKTPEAVRFDDVTLSPVTAFDLASPAALAYNTLAGSQAFTVQYAEKRQPSFQVSQEALPPTIRAAAPRKDEYLVLGRPFNSSLAIAAECTPDSDTSITAGLLMGWTGHDQPHYRFQVKRNAVETLCALLKILPDGGSAVLDMYALPSHAQPPLRLMADTTESGLIRCYLNDLLVHREKVPAPVTGGMGLWLAKGGSATFGNLELMTSVPRILEQQQKNPVFQKDSFMRHWASPEGQWISGGKDLLWHKGDFFGDFSILMPAVPNTELHLAVPDGKDQGTVVILAQDSKLTLETRAPEQEPQIQAWDIVVPDGTKRADLRYEVKHEGSWLWLEVGGQTVLRQRLGFLLKKCGTRVLAKRLTLTHMAQSKVTRSKVIDEFFNESPHDWLTNGGDWQIINRFQCTPSWSHMIDEAPNGLGAIWRKQIFTGDLTLEFYAGTRHNYYDKMGNLNCTIMAADNTPSSGYTVACTQWDQNLSQNWTTFYRNGKPIDKSSAYLVPRRRKGMYRRILNPLVAQGRPYHGAWFYIKLRKIGDKLEYYFDDELIFTEHDPQALQRGLVGIWTFVHSMTLAQIKITFDHVENRPFEVKLLPVAPGTAAQPQATASNIPQVHGFPLAPLNRQYWKLDDRVAQGTLTFADRSMSVTSRLGGGEMKAEAKLPSIPLDKLAGWAFEVRRTPTVRFNYFYAFEGTPHRYFHHITGTEFSDGLWKQAGATQVPPGEWTTVRAWIPPRFRRADASKTKVAVGGFGLEQLDFLASGIGGNVPGDRYAIRAFRPVFYGKPEIKTENAALNEEYAKRLAAARPDSQGIYMAQLPFNGADYRVEWVNLPEQPDISLEWDSQIPNTIRCTNRLPFPDPRLTGLTMAIANTKLEMRSEPGEGILGALPRLPAIQQAMQEDQLSVKLDGTGFSRTISLPAKAAKRLRSAPVLLKLDGLTPFCCTFENGPQPPLAFEQGRMDFGWAGPQAHVLTIRNTDSNQRLRTNFQSDFSLVNYPVAQMRYRAGDMAQVSMTLKGHQALRLSPDDRGAYSVRHAKAFALDDQWHTWTGLASDACDSSPYSASRFQMTDFRIASIGNIDQTGRYSHYALDDFVFGPAVANETQLACTPAFFDFDGVQAVQHAILPGNVPWHDIPEKEREALAWNDAKPDEKLLPKLPASLKDGLHHLLLRARNVHGLTSQPLDVPFLLDRQPLTTSFRFEEDAKDSFLRNGTRLRVELNNHGLSPWAIEKARFQADGKKISVTPWGSNFDHRPSTEILTLNYAFLLRNLLNKAQDGEVITISIDRIMDGAGNPTPRLDYFFLPLQQKQH